MMEHHQKCKEEIAESSLLELCRATQHFDDESKCKRSERRAPSWLGGYAERRSISMMEHQNAKGLSALYPSWKKTTKPTSLRWVFVSAGGSKARIQSKRSGDGTEDTDYGLDDYFPGFFVFHRKSC